MKPPRLPLPAIGRLAGVSPSDRRGTASIEAAVVLPVLALIAIAGMGLAHSIWVNLALEEVAQEAARCSARSDSCGSTAPACGAADLTVCFAVDLASRRGYPALSASLVAVDRAVTVNGVTFTDVTITLSRDVFGYTIIQKGKGRYANSQS